jgi:hypothetical protein
MKPDQRRLWFEKFENGLNKRDRLNSDHIEAFAATDVFAAHRVVATDHVALGFGKSGAVAIIGSPRQLCLLPPYDPFDLILPLLPAVRTCHDMGTLFRPLVKKISFFHKSPLGPHSGERYYMADSRASDDPRSRFYCISSGVLRRVMTEPQDQHSGIITKYVREDTDGSGSP